MAKGLADHELPHSAMQLQLMLHAEGGEGNGNCHYLSATNGPE